MDDVTCVGSETRIEDCNHNGWGVHNCGHGEDVSISCIPSKNILLLICFCWKHQAQKVCAKNHAIEQNDLVWNLLFEERILVC